MKKKGFHPLTLLLVYCLTLLGVGYGGANRIMSFWNLKHFTKNTYIRYAKYVTENVVEHTKNILGKCRDAVFKHYENKGHKPVDGKLDTDVAYELLGTREATNRIQFHSSLTHSLSLPKFQISAFE